MDAIHDRRSREIGRTDARETVAAPAAPGQVIRRDLPCMMPGKVHSTTGINCIKNNLYAIKMFLIVSLIRPSRFPIVATAAYLLSSPAVADQGGVAFLEKLSVVPSTVMTVCHGFGCAYRDQLALTPAKMTYLRGVLQSARSASEERKAIGKAVAWLDREDGRAAGTVGRIARAGAGTKSGPSQMDCIDLTANITELLIVLDRNKLLKFHRVGDPVSRGLIVDGKQPHTTPVIVEIATGTEWSVDSWTKAYGESPDIMTISEWKTRS